MSIESDNLHNGADGEGKKLTGSLEENLPKENQSEQPAQQPDREEENTAESLPS